MATLKAKAVQTSNEKLVTASVQDFMASNGFVQVHKEVRKNANGYSYITFINSKNEAENVYFASTIASEYPAGTPIEKGFFAGLQIGETYNAAGELRIKLIPISSGNSQRLDVSDLF